MRSELHVDVRASPRALFELAADISRWPDLLPHYRRVVVRSRAGRRIVADMVAERRFGGLRVPVTWRAEQWPDDSLEDDLRLNFRHVRGVTAGMEVRWHIRPRGAGCRVTIEHTFARSLPLVGDQLLPRFVNRVFIRPIATRTLTTFKALAESGR